MQIETAYVRFRITRFSLILLCGLKHYSSAFNVFCFAYCIGRFSLTSELCANLTPRLSTKPNTPQTIHSLSKEKMVANKTENFYYKEH